MSLESIEGLTGRLATLGLVHAAWIGLLVAAVASIAFQLLPRLSHRARHALLASALVSTVLGSLLAVAVQRYTLTEIDRAHLAPIRVSVSSAQVTNLPPMIPDEPVPTISNPDAGFRVSRGRLWVTLVGFLEAAQPYVLGAWLLVVGCLSLRLFLARLAVSRLIKDSEIAPPAIRNRAADLAEKLGLRRVPSVLAHPWLSEPGITGIIDPKILLPTTWLESAAPDQVDAILAHELAHARRRDLPANLVQRLVEVVLFFHPAVRWISNALYRERELCADALAVTITGDPVALASALESVARLRFSTTPSPSRTPVLGASIGGETSSLLPRIQELLGMTPKQPARRSLWPWISIPVAGLLAILGTSLGLAGDPPQALRADLPPTKGNLTKAGQSTVETVYAEVSQAIESSPEAANSDTQISYLVNFFSASIPRWRSVLKEDQIGEVHREGKINAWLIRDQKSTGDLTRSLLSCGGSSLTAMPKVTTFEGQRATFTVPGKNWIATVRKFQGRDSHPSQGVSKNLILGSQVDLQGKIFPHAVQLTVDHYETSLISPDGGVSWMSQNPSDKSGGNLEKQPIDPPSPPLLTRHFRVARAIPEGACLLISLGQTDDVRVSRATGDCNSDKAKPVVRERLIFIKPAVIQLEPEKLQAVPTSNIQVRPTVDAKLTTPLFDVDFTPNPFQVTFIGEVIPLPKHTCLPLHP